MANTISGLLKERCTFINKAMHNHGNMKEIGEAEMKAILQHINQRFDEIENLITPYVSGGCKFHGCSIADGR
jgi:peroxiredoxin family protein